MQIRQATVADAAIISALNMDVQRVHSEAHPEIFKQIDDPGFAVAYLADQLAQEQNVFYIAEMDGEAVGYVFAAIARRPAHAYMHGWSFVYINQISVKPAHRGKGIGSALIHRVRELAKETGIATIALDTWAFNTQAQAFFKAQGFTPFNIRMWQHIDLNDQDKESL